LAIDLKDPGDLAALKRLIARADVLIQNFRLGVIERLGLGYEDVRSINPCLVHGGISGYGESARGSTCRARTRSRSRFRA
jgi:crotonobetainyl-CoA:carnitine CoA-transferase CaiB-like acyl-CoA transferase